MEPLESKVRALVGEEGIEPTACLVADLIAMCERGRELKRLVEVL